MTDRPVRLPAHPEAHLAPALPGPPSPSTSPGRGSTDLLPDPLSDVLRTVRLRAAVFFVVETSSPWATAMPDGAALAPIVLPRTQQVISYHVITRGVLWGGLPGGPPMRFDTGDIVVFPRGDAYFMSSGPQAPVVSDHAPALTFMAGMASGHLPFLVRDGGGGNERATAVCGFLGCDVRPFNPLLATLPRLLHIKRAAGAVDDRLDRLLEITVAESRERAPGAETVRLRLSELMFVEVIRRYLAGQPPEQAGWLAGLQDEFVGRALCRLHERAAHGWTLDQLAGDVGLSRSAFADRFMRLVGEPPIQYLMRWRMQMAASLLTDGSDKVATIAQEVGYESEAAFSRAFKKLTGLSPVAWRRNTPGQQARQST